MSALSVTMPEPDIRWILPARGSVGMYCLIAAEAAIFTIFVFAYIFYIGKSLSGPQPQDVLQVSRALLALLPRGRKKSCAFKGNPLSPIEMPVPVALPAIVVITPFDILRIRSPMIGNPAYPGYCDDARK